MTVSCSANKKLMQDDIKSDVSASTEEKDLVISDFTLGVGDQIEITVYRHQDLSKKSKISPSGSLYFPLIGSVQANGKGIRQIQDELTKKFSNYIVNPQISVEVISYEGQKLFVLGEVENPGVYQMRTPMTIIDAISTAGGITSDGKVKSVLLIRGNIDKPDIVNLNLKKGDLSQNVPLRKGDVVYVPRTFVANVDRFFEHISTWIRPVLTLERAIVLTPQVEDVLDLRRDIDSSSSSTTTSVIIGTTN